MRTFVTTSAAETKKIGHALGKKLKEKDIVLFTADLGAGKTTFVQGLGRALGIDEDAVSPTFIIAQTLHGKKTLHHLDFYRLSKKEILDMGIEDYLTGAGLIGPGVVAVEWAERFPELWPLDYVHVVIKMGSKPTQRRITLKAKGKRSAALLKSL